jgi:cellulose synthase/poly-beta-1,6-N-acetylglucosamine synthase-like glycosyltransferase
MASAAASNHVLVIGLGSAVATDVIAPLVAAGYEVQLGAAADLGRRRWTAVLGAPAMPGLGGMELLAALREGPQPAPPLLLVGPAGQLPFSGRPGSGVPGLECLAWPFSPEALVTRVRDMTRGSLPPRAADSLLPPPVPVPVLGEEALLAAAKQEIADLQAARSAGEGYLVALRLHELDQFRERLDPALEDSLWQQVAGLTTLDALASEQVGRGSEGDFLLLLPGSSRREAAERLQILSKRVAAHGFQLGGQEVQFSPAIGYRALRRSPAAAVALAQARDAAGHSALHLDLEPVLWRGARTREPREPGPLRAWWSRLAARHALVLQYLLTMTLGLVVPFLVYWALGRSGHDISKGVYIFVVASLVFTALAIWAEGFLALARIDPPKEPAAPYPPASAIIAAYLPNEAPIIEDTVRAFLRVQYPAGLQVILAYNTPRDMPEIEERLREIAREHPRFIPMRVRTSTSKAQNVNAALPYATGEFTAVFDADHQPDPDSFRRAWRWLSNGADVVQGHCFIRNGAASWVAKMVAIEFEQIYAVSHPGRARLHGFGIFGGSNGYWRTGLLRELRMHGFMLTEDIDSSMRAVVRGQRIVSDPYLVSRELAPETMAALTRQRLRWAQGWLQISLKWMVPAMRARNLGIRQKLGMIQLLAWRELYPWVSIQILPLIAWWAVQAGSLARIEWFVPLFVVTTLFTLSTGPGQILFTWHLADRALKKHPGWFGFYVVTSVLFYAGLKNAWNRIAHYKEWRGETAWVVTPRVQPKK